MPIVRPYPIGEVSPQPIPNVAPSVPAASDINLFGGNRARDLQVAGQNLGQASDSLFALYQRKAQDANDTRVQDFTNRFLDGRRAILQTGPDAYYNQTGADAITGADAATGQLTTLRDEVLGQTATTTSARSSPRSLTRISRRRPRASCATPPRSRRFTASAWPPTRSRPRGRRRPPIHP
jgi:hypothetical protein